MFTKPTRCFRRRCQLPVQIHQAFIMGGVVFCSRECYYQWLNEAETQVAIRKIAPRFDFGYKENPVKVHD